MMKSKAQLLIRETSLGTSLPGWMSRSFVDNTNPASTGSWFDDFFSSSSSDTLFDDMDSFSASGSNMDVLGLPMTDWSTQIPDL